MSLQGAREDPLRFGLERRFVPAHPPDAEGASNRREQASDDGGGTAQAIETFTEHVRRQSVSGSPDYSPRCIEDEEAPPIHAVHPGEEGRQCAQDGHESTEEHNLSAVPGEKKLPELDASRVNPYEAAMPQQECVAEPAAD